MYNANMVIRSTKSVTSLATRLFQFHFQQQSSLMPDLYYWALEDIAAVYASRKFVKDSELV
jgi:hypothetical protein